MAATVLSIYLWVVPVSMHIIAKEMECRWRDILPFASWSRTVVQLMPLLVIWLIVVWLVKDPLAEFLAVTIGFAAFLGWYWNGKLYSLETLWKQVAARFAR